MNNIYRGFVLKVLYPVLMLAGSVMGSERKERMQAFVIRLNNKLILGSGLRTSRILLLLPHCLQIDKCEIRLTHNVRNCKQCGRCGIKDLIAISDEKGIELFVASGGNLARRVVLDVKPEAIVAVACERDLSSGIADVFPIPVYGVPNERPCGPCLNTKVDMGALRSAIEALAP